MTEWTFREQVIISIIEGKGHIAVTDNTKGWVVCSRCHVSWWVTRRAEMADTDRVADMGNLNAISSAPLVFDVCDP